MTINDLGQAENVFNLSKHLRVANIISQKMSVYNLTFKQMIHLP